jgi:hypothetical protein
MEPILIYLFSLPNLIIYTLSGGIFGAIAGGVGFLISKKIQSKKFAQIITIILLVISIQISNTLVHHFQKEFLINNESTNKYSKPELIKLAVNRIKNDMSFPKKLDENTTLIDVSAEPDAIRYHYVLSGIDTSKITNAYLKNFLAPNVCKGIATLLNEGINAEYSYVVKDLGEKYFVSFSKSDCDL